MVDPAADKIITSDANATVSRQRDIPESCIKHTGERIRSVRNCFFYRNLLYNIINNRKVKLFYGQNQHVVLFLVHSIGVMH